MAELLRQSWSRCPHTGAGNGWGVAGGTSRHPGLSPVGVPPTIVSDAAAALAALQAQPGLPNRGVVALCDFDASGSSITLADAGAGLTFIGETVRFPISPETSSTRHFNHVLAGATAAGQVDPAATAAVGSLVRLSSEVPTGQGALVHRDRHGNSPPTSRATGPRSRSPGPNWTT